MMAKFTYEEHQKKMRQLLQTPVQGSPLIAKLREAALKRKQPKV